MPADLSAPIRRDEQVLGYPDTALRSRVHLAPVELDAVHAAGAPLLALQLTTTPDGRHARGVLELALQVRWPAEDLTAPKVGLPGLWSRGHARVRVQRVTDAAPTHSAWRALEAVGGRLRIGGLAFDEVTAELLAQILLAPAPGASLVDVDVVLELDGLSGSHPARATLSGSRLSSALAAFSTDAPVKRSAALAACYRVVSTGGATLEGLGTTLSAAQTEAAWWELAERLLEACFGPTGDEPRRAAAQVTLRPPGRRGFVSGAGDLEEQRITLDLRVRRPAVAQWVGRWDLRELWEELSPEARASLITLSRPVLPTQGYPIFINNLLPVDGDAPGLGIRGVRAVIRRRDAHLRWVDTPVPFVAAALPFHVLESHRPTGTDEAWSYEVSVSFAAPLGGGWPPRAARSSGTGAVTDARLEINRALLGCPLLRVEADPALFDPRLLRSPAVTFDVTLRPAGDTEPAQVVPLDEAHPGRWVVLHALAPDAAVEGRLRATDRAGREVLGPWRPATRGRWDAGVSALLPTDAERLTVHLGDTPRVELVLVTASPAWDPDRVVLQASLRGGDPPLLIQARRPDLFEPVAWRLRLTWWLRGPGGALTEHHEDRQVADTAQPLPLLPLEAP